MMVIEFETDVLDVIQRTHIRKAILTETICSLRVDKIKQTNKAIKFALGVK